MHGLAPSIALAAAVTACACACARAQGLPPPPQPGAAATLGGATLYLELVVNQQATGQVVPVLVKNGSYHVAADTLRALHVRTPATGAELVAVDRIDGLGVRYDSVAQRLELMLPPTWLPEQQLGAGGPVDRLRPLVGRGFLLNYELYASNPGRAESSTALWTEQRWFGRSGLWSNTGVARHTRSGASGNFSGSQGYLRYDTSWRYSDTDAVRTVTAGDLITATLPWGSAVRIGGIQVARNFAIRPDLVPYPLPTFSGQAAVPSAVDLFINGQRAGRENVLPGPFTLNTMPFITGAGEAAVVTTDALGRQVLTTVPFYVASTLLKRGTDDYAVSAGALRRGYGEDSFGYGRAVASGSWRYGWSDALTLEARGELARGLTVGGGGAVATLGRYGVLNGALAHGGNGVQWTAGYQYNAQRFGLALQHTQRSAGWRDLADLDRDAGASAGRSNTQLTTSLSLGALGAVAIGYFDARARDGARSRVATASYSRALGSSSFVSMNLNKALGTDDYLVQLQWTLLLGDRGAMSVVGTRDRNGFGRQLQYSRTPPPAGGLGWNLSYANGAGPDDYRQGSMTWRGDHLQLQGGAYAQGGRSATWAGASGSLVAMDGGWFAANRINDAFALVATGVGDVPVRFENQVIGRTDARGHLLVPGVNAYYPARFEIDLLDLPEDLQVAQSEQRVLLGAGSGALLRFPIQQVRAASITLVDSAGQPLPVGMSVQLLGSGRSATLGWDGQVYLEGLAQDNELLVRGAGVPSCRARFTLAEQATGVARLGPLVCRPLPPNAQQGR
ncbi:fimbria/pilus outer membrane usher protein [Pseudorhodoferax soli]|uniref:Outer membrane usher protein n=1 Tax=Pseudorhodoferax soli TaxID=545864 RepID=A0A368XB52_9BURK|nr:fimbria/pilus outer membrane usher protein [Pseudorhodoferax soli]RCW65192.1 outer membrane usher protein [Pseudorhodoferax soli]